MDMFEFKSSEPVFGKALTNELALMAAKNNTPRQRTPLGEVKNDSNDDSLLIWKHFKNVSVKRVKEIPESWCLNQKGILWDSPLKLSNLKKGIRIEFDTSNHSLFAEVDYKFFSDHYLV